MCISVSDRVGTISIRSRISAATGDGVQRPARRIIQPACQTIPAPSNFEARSQEVGVSTKIQTTLVEVAIRRPALAVLGAFASGSRRSERTGDRLRSRCIRRSPCLESRLFCLLRTPWLNITAVVPGADGRARGEPHGLTGIHPVTKWHTSHDCAVTMWLPGLPVAVAPLWQVAQVPGGTVAWLKTAGIQAVVR